MQTHISGLRVTLLSALLRVYAYLPRPPIPRIVEGELAQALPRGGERYRRRIHFMHHRQEREEPVLLRLGFRQELDQNPPIPLLKSIHDISFATR